MKSQKKVREKKKFVKPKVIKRIKIETRAGWCGTNGKEVIGQSGCAVSYS